MRHSTFTKMIIDPRSAQNTSPDVIEVEIVIISDCFPFQRENLIPESGKSDRSALC
jgi:hypothetical protein